MLDRINIESGSGTRTSVRTGEIFLSALFPSLEVLNARARAIQEKGITTGSIVYVGRNRNQTYTVHCILDDKRLHLIKTGKEDPLIFKKDVDPRSVTVAK